MVASRPTLSQPRFRWFFALPIIGAQRTDYSFDLSFKGRRILLPISKIRRITTANFVGFAVLPLEKVPIKIDGNQRKNLLSPLSHKCLLFCERRIDFVIHPPTFQ